MPNSILTFDSKFLTYQFLKIKSYAYIEGIDIKYLQSMDVYQNYVIFLFSDNTSSFFAYVYNLLTLEKVGGKINFPYNTNYLPHPNSCCFGKEKFNENSFFPALYVSEWSSGLQDRSCLVYDIKLENNYLSATLKKTIKPSKNISAEIVGNGNADYVVDTDNNCLYMFAYKINNGSTIPESEGNKEMIVKISNPPLNEENVTFEESDILDHYTLSPWNISQDKKYRNGKIFFLSGENTSKEYQKYLSYKVLDLQRKELVTNCSLLYFNGEPEALAFYDNKLLFTSIENSFVYEIKTNYNTKTLSVKSIV